MPAGRAPGATGAPVPWPAPQARGPLDAVVELPGSKSLTVRALLLAAVASGPSELVGVLRSRDTDLMVAALTTLGARVEPLDQAGTHLRVTPAPRPFAVGSGARVDCGLAGTVMRFVPPLAVLADAPVTFDGDAAARRRPLGPLLEALEHLGAGIDYLGEADHLPVRVTPRPAPHRENGTCSPRERYLFAARTVRTGSEGPRAPGAASAAGTVAPAVRSAPTAVRTIAGPARVHVDASDSSQMLSALLLVGSLLPDGLEVTPTGPVPSLPHVAMTVACLRDRGVVVDEPDPAQVPGQRTWRVHPGAPSGGRVVIEPDLSNAGPFLAAALVAGGRVSVPRWPAATTQAGDAWRRLLPRMGGHVTTRRQADGSLTLTVRGDGRLRGVDVDLGEVGELATTVAALAVLAGAQGQASRLRGLAHLRGHETDRLAALVAETRRLGGSAYEVADGLAIDPSPVHPARLRTYADHRMATFAAVVGLGVAGVEVEDVSATSKTLPGFPTMWSDMLSSAGASGAAAAPAPADAPAALTPQGAEGSAE
nr:3-phosphoshikimate 1-carboxyvinyltransferase [uncultured Actinomyces sp.]